MPRPIPDGLRLPRHSSRYRRALNSHYWRDLRIRLIRERGACEHCGHRAFAGGDRLTLHHLTYARLGLEPDEDVQLLCTTCHRRQFKADNPHLIA
jgi:5-methylcytosine-specific restriction endonuclease McrA